MSSVTNGLSLLHLGLLAVFVGGTGIAMMVAIARRLRIRRPLLVWRDGPLTRIPLGATIFLGLVTCGLAGAWVMGYAVPTLAWIGYPTGGLFWFVATGLARSVLVTDDGIVHDPPRREAVVAWRQMVDYVVQSRNGRPHFVFFYRGADGPVQRLDLTVPDSYADAFAEIARVKLDFRFLDSARRAYGEEIVGPPSDLFGRC